MKPLVRRALCAIGIHDNHKIRTPFESVNYCRSCMKVHHEDSTASEIVFWCVGLPAALFLIMGILLYQERGRSYDAQIFTEGEKKMITETAEKRAECYDCHKRLL